MDAAPHEHETEFGTGLRAHLGLGGLAHETAPAPAPPPRATGPDVGELEERARALRAAAQELEARERRLARQQAELAAESQRLAEQQAALEQQLLTDPRPVPVVLRERAEQHVERLWRSLFSALEATRPDGSADFATRVSAARALLAAAYGDGAPAAAPTGAEDELALLRARRAELGF
ncbi:MAG TPA: hypothetical protein VM290_02805 [Gaiellaceae bacterium]|nr:hypothetical protein [Gaiellaceae bacterium]